MSEAGAGPGRPRKEGVRRAVLDAAVDLVGADGYRATTLDEIARAAGVAKTTVYRRWDSKAALVADALLDRLGELPAVEADGGVRASVAWLAGLVARPATRALLFGVLAEEGDGELRARLREEIRRPFVAALRTGWEVEDRVAATAYDLVVGTLLFSSTQDDLDAGLVADVTDLVVRYLDGAGD